jgi:hypothetical protein
VARSSKDSSPKAVFRRGGRDFRDLAGWRPNQVERVRENMGFLLLQGTIERLTRPNLVERESPPEAEIDSKNLLGARPRNRTGRSFIPLSLVSLDLQIGAHW